MNNIGKINQAKFENKEHAVCYNKKEDYYFAIHISDIKYFHVVSGIYKTIQGMINLVNSHNSFNDNPCSYEKGQKSIINYLA